MPYTTIHAAPRPKFRDILNKAAKTPRPAPEHVQEQAAAERTAAIEQRRAYHDEQTRQDALLARLTPSDWKEYSNHVLGRYADNGPVSKILRSKPPHECRLMRMEIARMIEGSAKQER